ncbi:MAG: alkaline phosphatase family protein [Saprospiraceae bacterium]|nr:alkaline phosphatase family protein [Saprospiraceae bacterium]
MDKPFKRVITVMFENQYRNYVIKDPFLKKLASAGADMTNYFGAFHPSQTNYLASFAGEICGVTNDTPPAKPLKQKTLVDILEAKSVSWKAYMEGYPIDRWNPAWTSPDYPESEQPITEYPPKGAKDLSRYYRKHNAFASFHNVQKEEKRWNKIVNDEEFWVDVVNDTLPEYSWYTPDIWNDGHYLYNTHIDTNPRTELVPQLSAWLEHVFFGNIETSKIQGGADSQLDNWGLNLDVDLLLTDPQQAWKNSNIPEGTLIVVTFDEADYDASGYDTNYDGPNQIYTVLLGDMIEPGTVISTPYNHYSLIRTVQENFKLDSLNKNDFEANWFRFLWKEKFQWSSPINTNFPSSSALAISKTDLSVHLVFADSDGVLAESFLENDTWSASKPIGMNTKGSIAMDTIDGTTIMVLEGNNGQLLFSAYNPAIKKWAEPHSINQNTSGSFALSSYRDVANSSNKLMLCWVDDNGFIQSTIGDASGFSGPLIPVKQLTDGPMALRQLGASLFLVYKERNTRKMRITSYNVGPFNAFEAVDFQGNKAPNNYTTLHQWSPTDYVVGHFSKKMAALANEYQNLGQMAMATISGEMHLVHRGGYEDTPNAFTEMFGLNGIYTASSQFTNGFGTLAQAGWTLETEMSDITIAPTSPIAMCAGESKIVLVWSDTVSNNIVYREGGYKEVE